MRRGRQCVCISQPSPTFVFSHSQLRLTITANRYVAHAQGAVQCIKAVESARADIVVTTTTSSATVWNVSRAGPSMHILSYVHIRINELISDCTRTGWHELLTIPDLPVESTAHSKAEVALTSALWLEGPDISEGKVQGLMLCTYMWHGIA